MIIVTNDTADLMRFNFIYFGMFFSYGLDVNLDRVEDVLLHQKLLARAKDPDNRPVFHIRFLEVCMPSINIGTR